MASFQVLNIGYSQKINGIKSINLSLAQFEMIRKKPVLGKQHIKEGRMDVSDHLKNLIGINKISESSPLLILSVRNVLSNLRCIAYINDSRYKGYVTVEEEVLESRPYFILGRHRDKGLVIEEFNANSNGNDKFSWFVSGVPVLWDNEDNNLLFNKMVTEEADHSHIWYIPRGNHPDASDESRGHWNNLQNIMLETLIKDRDTVFKALNGYAEAHSLRREENILHNIVGTDDSGNLYQHIARGKMEDLGKQIGLLGAKRAICVDNSGSTTVFYYPKGLLGNNRLQLISAPNHRLLGTAYLIIELNDDQFTL